MRLEVVYDGTLSVTMGDNDANVERLEPHEAYGLQGVPKSRGEALRAVQEELHREMARRAGAYGRSLAELFKAIEEARQAFEAGLDVLVENARRGLGPQAASRSRHEVVDHIDEVPPERGAVTVDGFRAVEHYAERHGGLMAEATTVRHHLIIHREAMGFRGHHLVEEIFPLPAALPPLEVAWRQAREKLKKTKRQATTESSPVV